MAKTLTEVKKELELLRLEEMRLEAANFQERVKPFVSAAIGKTFVFRNNSSGGPERWDTFRKPVAFEFDQYSGWMFFEECEIRSDNGCARIETQSELIRRDSAPAPFLERGWKACNESEYDRVRSLALEQLGNPTLAVEKIKAERVTK